LPEEVLHFVLKSFTKNHLPILIFKPRVTTNMVFQIESKRVRWVGHVALMGERKGILVGKSEGKKPLGRPRCKWEDILRYIFKEVRWGGKDWIDLAQDRDRWRALVNAVMNIRVP
jgi:hypothetical protein